MLFLSKAKQFDYLVHLNILCSRYDNKSIYGSIKMLVLLKTYLIKMYPHKS